MVSREEFDRLLTACMDTYAEAVQANFRGADDYEQCVEKAAQARAALVKAVFG